MQRLEQLRPCQPMDATATILASDWLTPTIKSIWLELDQSNFRFLPGQAIWPQFEREGKRFSKIYSMSSCPSYSPRIELCVSRVGWSSAYLQDLSIGGTIPLRGAYGLLTLDALPQNPRLYIAEGSGIAPVRSHIQWLRHCRFRHPIWLIQANPETTHRLPYQGQWRSLASEWPSFHYIEAIDQSPEQLLPTLDASLGDIDIDICAVDDRVEHIYNALLLNGANPERVRSEKFFAF